MKKSFYLLVVILGFLGSYYIYAQAGPIDPGTGNPPLICYNTFQVGGDIVITKCNGCSLQARVKNAGDKSSCRK